MGSTFVCTPAMGREMRRLVSDLAPAGVIVREGPPSAWNEGPSPYEEEEAVLARAVDSRKQQYRAARSLFRRALGDLGLPMAPLLNDSERAPIWPPGVIGSLTHTAGWCAVALSQGTLAALGIDVEGAGALAPELVTRIATERERRWLSSVPLRQQAAAGKVLFSAKESLYKSQYPISRQFLGFHDVELDVDLDANTFRCRFLVSVPTWNEHIRRFHGRMARTPELVATLVFALP